MIDKIGVIKKDNEPVSDLDVVFVSVYNLLAEKMDSRDDKGIVILKGKPNQRKVSWKKVLSMAHAMEDYFRLREQNTGGRQCELCESWRSASEASPHLGKCKNRPHKLIHEFSSCKRFKEAIQYGKD